MANVSWKDIDGYEGIYQISDSGHIRNCYATLLKPYKTRGYLQIRLRKNGIRKNFYIHRLVAMAFIPNLDNKPQINHINGIKTDNRVENLEWVSGSENLLHAVETGLLKPNRKLTDAQVREIRNLFIRYNHNFGSQALARKYGVSNKRILDIINQKSYKNV